MPTLIEKPTEIPVPGNKIINEYVGKLNTGSSNVSVAHMQAPGGWEEPGQKPEFEEITVVLKGTLHLEYLGGHLDVRAGQAVITHKGEWVRYSTPDEEGAEYVAICLPAFSPDLVHRDGEG